MKIIAISDIHGKLPQIDNCDLLTISGDICPTIDHSISFQKNWLQTNFKWWLSKLPAKYIVFIAGNHDFFFEKFGRQYTTLFKFPDNVHYLQDSMIELEGVKIYGTPWQPIFYDWAFNLDENGLSKKFSKIPEGIDIILAHGPPYNVGNVDVVLDNIYDNPNVIDMRKHLGSTSLTNEIKRVKPKYVLVGHIHSGDHNPTVIIHDENILDRNTNVVNVAMLNEKYNPYYKPFVFYYPI